MPHYWFWSYGEASLTTECESYDSMTNRAGVSTILYQCAPLVFDSRSSSQGMVPYHVVHMVHGTVTLGKQMKRETLEGLLGQKSVVDFRKQFNN